VLKALPGVRIPPSPPVNPLNAGFAFSDEKARMRMGAEEIGRKNLNIEQGTQIFDIRNKYSLHIS